MQDNFSVLRVIGVDSDVTVLLWSIKWSHFLVCFLGDTSQLDFDAVCENDTAMAALMNYFEAEGGLGDPAELSDMQWTL